MRVFKTKWFRRFARAEGITDVMLCEAVARAERGLVDADLGGGVIKQRGARPGEGRSGGFRNLIVYRSGDRAVFVFVFGFAKSDRENLEPDELADLKETAKLLLGYNAAALGRAVDNHDLWEVICDDQKV